jgi:flagellar basal-body rod protein FlgF
VISGIHELIDGSLVQKLRFDTIANNLANSNTNGFKKDIISFHQILTMENNSSTDFAPGPIHYTGNQLDVALDGPGFFKVQSPRGMRYTRDGSFTLNGDQQLVTQSGDIVLGQNGPVKIDGGEVSIDTDGTVVVSGAQVERLAVVDLRQTQLLIKEGNSCYRFEGEERDIFPAEKVRVQNGYLESSNVNPTEEMIKMVEALRVFESAQKAIQCIDELTGKMVNDAGLLQ